MFRQEIFQWLLENCHPAIVWGLVAAYVVFTLAFICVILKSAVVEYRKSHSMKATFDFTFINHLVLIGFYALSYILWFGTGKPIFLLLIILTLQIVPMIRKELNKATQNRDRNALIYVAVWLLIFLIVCFVRYP